MIFWPGFAVRSMITGRSGDHRCHTGAKCRPAPAAILTRRKTEPKRWHQRSGYAFQYRHASAVGQEQLEKYTGLQDEVQRLCSPGRGKLHRQGPHGTPANRAGCTGFATVVKGVNAQVGIGRQACASKANRDALRGRYRDGIMRTAARHPPVIDPCGLRNNAGGRPNPNRRLRDCAMPMPR